MSTFKQNESALPVPGSNQKKSEYLLPKFFRTDTNRKFLGSTVDQLISSGSVEKVNAFVGRRTAKSKDSSKVENYIPDVSADRENYQLEPALVEVDDLGNVSFYKDYIDYIGQLKNFKSKTKNHSKMNSQEFYVWNPNIDFDKFTNFREYYWLPNGPLAITVFGKTQEIESTYTVSVVRDDDNDAYVFSPDGFTRNPTLTLYRGETYYFEVNAKGYGMAFATNRTFLDLDPVKINDLGQNVSALYKKGVESKTDYVEKGVIKFKVPEDAPDTLYYVSETDINVSGIIYIKNIEENTFIDVESEIIGKKTFKSTSDVNFSNGMKLKFVGQVTPEKYKTGNWYVEGVGEAIRLISEIDLDIPAQFTEIKDVPFDGVEFDTTPLENSAGYPVEKDYIVINRASADGNPWSRYNRWFHQAVILESARLNNQEISLDQDLRAKRPIIEFEAGLKLFNHGTRVKGVVDLVDNFTKDVFSTIEGSLGYYVDNTPLSDGMRILFTADTDPIVKGRIYQVKFIVHNGSRIITLIPTEDSEPANNQVVVVRMGERFAGSTFFYSGSSWRQSQRKTRVNQHPLFDLYDLNGDSFANRTTYPATTFNGNRIFGYKIGDGTPDVELKFPLTYQNISNIGDIVFEFDLLKNSFVYQKDNENIEIKTDVGFLRKYDYLGNRFSYVSGWVKSDEPSKQYVVRQYAASGVSEDYKIDVYDNVTRLTDLEVKVFVNNHFKTLNKDYTIVTIFNDLFIRFNNNLEKGDSVIIKTHSLADKNSNGFYEIPKNLENNPLNENVTDFTLGEVNDHVSSIIENLDSFDGVFPGSGNLRDIGNYKVRGRKFLQHSGPLNLALFNITDQSANAVKAVRKAKKDYATFKKQFLKAAFESPFTGSAREHVDSILETLNIEKTDDMPYYTSDMVPYSGNRLIEYNVIDVGSVFYALPEVFTLTNLCTRSVLVYINEVQLIHGLEYVFDQDGFVQILKELQLGDVIKISYYENTNGSFVPPTPSKLGLYPKFIPEIYIDDTYLEPKRLIKGHDGSITLAFNDYRDDLLLELEKRIYNNIKVSYNPAILDIHEFVGGAFRNTGFTSKEIDDILITDFSHWVSGIGAIDYGENTAWDISNPFTYNYKNAQTVDDKTISGTWRKIFVDLYDTDRPHSHPWEMLGFADKPLWWEEVYGPAPYTSNNLVLWNDIERGIIREPNRPVIKNEKYARLGVKKYLPVDENGKLLSPFENNYVSQMVVYESNKRFEFGDWAPAETAWRKSSEYPFSLIVAWMILQPAKVFGLGFDRASMIRDSSGSLVYAHTQKRLKLSDIRFPQKSDSVCRLTGKTLSKNLTAGIVNYVADYLSNKTANYDIYKTRYQRLTNNLGFRLGGFAEKTKLKLVLDSRSPLNKGNVFVPDENYTVFLNKSSALETVVYSGVIIEKLEQGFRITGYDTESPFFEYNEPFITQSDSSIVIGGVSESFVEWNENSTYALGTVVRYNSSYYRTKISHTSTASFDVTKFSLLSDLPIVGGRRMLVRKRFSQHTSVMMYGTILQEIQQVVDFLQGYQNRLKNQGFKFEYVNSDTQALEDWLLAAKEFVFWTTQNWDVGSLIALSPAANKLIFEKPYHVVDNIYDGFYNYKILKSDGVPISRDFINTVRSNSNEFSIVIKSTSIDGIYFAKLPLVQKEHVVLIDNRTVFNDVIYDTVPGYRQERLLVVGYRTDDWNGSLNIPGFVYDQAFVTQWTPWTDYKVGDLVKYKEYYYSCNKQHAGIESFDDTLWNILPSRPQTTLLPNWDYKAEQISQFYSLEIENFDSEQQRLAQHLIGYQKRQYLENIINDEISQYKFYQGFIQDKGTKNALDKLFNALGNSEKDSLEFYEEWAIRVGQYGAVDSFGEVEFKLDERKYRLEPQTVELVSTEDPERTDLVYQLSKSEVFLAPEDYNNKPFPSYYVDKTFTKNSGYVNPNDVNFVVNTYQDILGYNVNDIMVGDYLWVLNEDQEWDVLKVINPQYKVLEITAEDDFYLIKFDTHVKIQSNNIVGFISSSDLVQGFYLVERVELDTVYLKSDKDLSSVNVSDTTIITLLMESRRFETFETVNNSIKDKVFYSNLGKVWIDKSQNSLWSVYENTIARDLQESNITPPSTFRLTGFGSSVAVNGNNTIMVVGSPDYPQDIDGNPQPDLGAVLVYNRNQSDTVFTNNNIVQVITPISDIGLDSNYGSEIEITDDGKFLFVSAPNASNVKTLYRGELDVTQHVAYNQGDIVYDNGKLWKSKVQPSYSDAPNFVDEWESAALNEYSKNGYSVSGLNNQGVVFVYEKDATTNSYILKTIVTSPLPVENELFGYKLKSSVSDGKYTLAIGAPGTNNVYIIENVDGEFKYKLVQSYTGGYKPNFYYTEGDVTKYGLDFYKSLTNIEFDQVFDASKWELLDSSYIFTSSVTSTPDDVELDSATGVGTVVDLSSDGTVIAVTGFNSTDFGANNVVSVYTLTEGIYKYTQTLQSLDQKEAFGTSVSISLDGKIAVGAPTNDSEGVDNGAVYVFTMENGQYTLYQKLISPANDFNEMFGQVVRFADQSLLVGSKNGDIRVQTTFDDEDTSFDQSATTFSSTSINTGNIYVYENLEKYFVYSDTRYKTEIGSYELKDFKAVKNHIYITLPGYNNGLVTNIFSSSNSSSWKKLASPVEAVNLGLIKRVYLYNTETKTLILDMDYIDPRQGKIAGPAEQEIAFKTYYDPAIYNYSTDDVDVITDYNSAWSFQNVGKLWWNISTAKWFNAYQGDSQYRVSYWNELLPDSSIDVYEWVETTLLPSQWDRLADTNDGFARGISGQSLYGDSAYTERKIYNDSNTSYTSLYYFWVKNKRILPASNFRKLTADAVANLISNPQTFGYRFVAFTGNDRFTLYNSKSLIDENNVVLHVSYFNENNVTANVHNEYQIIAENLSTSLPSVSIENKWIDSLVGYDINRKPVPDTTLPIKNKYGVLESPRQGMFIDRRFALKQVIDRVNLVLNENNIADGYDISLLYSKDPLPNEKSRLYDTVVDNYSELRFVNVARVEKAAVSPVIENGRIVSVDIINPGKGYKNPPILVIDDTYGTGAVLETSIDSFGKLLSVEVIKTGRNYTENTVISPRGYSVLVLADETADNKWSIFEWNILTQEWSRAKIQSYDTTKYWFFTDWYNTGYSSSSKIDHVVEYPYLLQSLNNKIGDTVKVTNLGSGGWAILKKVNNQNTSDYTVNYQTVARQNGTIQFSTMLYDYAAGLSGFDTNIYGTPRYDAEPVVELRKIFECLKNDIFVGDLGVEWNKLFFSSLRYVMSEQSNVDWLFKTSFVKVKHNFGLLDQKVTFKNNNLESYQSYVEEVKPYSTKIREFVSAYERTEPAVTATYDFDNPSFYNPETNKIENTYEVVIGGAIEGISENTDQSWLQNVGFKITEIRIINPGAGLTVPPKVIIDGGRVQAKAYLKRGSISFIEVLSNNIRYLTPPTVYIDVSGDEPSEVPQAVAVLGDSLVKTFGINLEFDRVSRAPEYQFVDVEEQFVGNGTQTEFKLKWPIDVNTKKTEVFVNDIEILRDEFDTTNITDSDKTYNRMLGVITFDNPPAAGSVIKVKYSREISVFNAVDRITHFYKPNPGMPGDLAQLMTGIEYGGVNVTSYGFGNEQGFSAGGFGTVPWDTFDLLSDDRQFVINTRKRRIQLDKPFDRGELYNVYLNNVRVDDPNYGTSTPVTNPNARLRTIIGNGTSTTYTIPTTLTYSDGDVLVFRKSTSDGSFAPRDFSYDSIVQGGTFLPGSASGLAASDITLDGEGFVTKSTSEGPEELVPGQITDALDLSVFHSPTDGSGIINSVIHRIENGDRRFRIPGDPVTNEAIIIKINNEILDEQLYTIDYKNDEIELKAQYPDGTFLSIVTVGVSGKNIYEYSKFVIKNRVYKYELPIVYPSDAVVLVSLNGRMLRQNLEYSVGTANSGRLELIFPTDLILANDVVNYIVFANTTNTFSQISVDRSFIPNGTKTVHKFDGVRNPVPFNTKPLAHKVLVKVDNKILKPGYAKKFTVAPEATYELDLWAVNSPNSFTESSIIAFIDGQELPRTEYNWNPITKAIEFVKPENIKAGSELEVTSVTDADYYFVDTQLDVYDIYNDPLNMEQVLSGRTSFVITAFDGTTYNITDFTVKGNTLTVDSYLNRLPEIVLQNPLMGIVVPPLIYTVNIRNIRYVSSDTMTFHTPPTQGSKVEIYQFSNHDINNFERVSYDVISNNSITLDTADETQRNLVLSGFIKLRVPAYDSKYVWVIKNGTVLTPDADYIITLDKTAIQLKDTLTSGDHIETFSFNSLPSVKRYGFRVFKDIFDRFSYKRINQNKVFRLSKPLNFFDKKISLESAEGLFVPNRINNVPGILFIKGERIEYFEVSGNEISDIRRGTLGTGTAEIYEAGSIVYDQNTYENVNYSDEFVTLVFPVENENQNRFTLDFSISDWIANANIPPSKIKDMFDVKVAGRRLEKNSKQVYNPEQAYDSPEADQTVPPEYTVDAVSNEIVLTVAPPVGVKVVVLRKLGKIWNDIGKPLDDSSTALTSFLLGTG